MLHMPDETRQALEQLEEIVKRIHFQYAEMARRETEPYIREIISIHNMYPKPLLITDLQLMGLLSAESGE